MTQYLSIFIPVGALLVAVGLWVGLPLAQLTEWTAEGGWIETVTLLAYAMALGVLCLAYLDRGRPRVLLAVLLVTAFLGAREMDLHMHLTGTSVLRLSYYFKASDAFQKLMAAVLVGSFFGCVLYLVVKYGASALRGCRRAEPVGLAVAAFLATAVISKILDRAASVLSQDLGWPVSPAAAGLIRSVEECLELALPAIIAVAAARFTRFSQAASPVESPEALPGDAPAVRS